jgi:hypothetical protein
MHHCTKQRQREIKTTIAVFSILIGALAFYLTRK